MDAWQTVLLAFGGSAGLLAVLVYLSKTLLEKILVRDTKVFEAELKARTDAEIERLKSEMGRNLESYKMQLKKSEYFFEREYAAALDFTSLARSILPRPDRPDMDWGDAMEQFVDRFPQIVAKLDDFLLAHAPALTAEEREVIHSVASSANDAHVHGVSGLDPAGSQLAESVYDKIMDLETRLTKRVREQSSL
jgi:hypothetical protein